MGELNRPAHHSRIAVVILLPELVAEHRHRLRILALRRIRRTKDSAQHGRQAEIAEVISREEDRPNVIGHIAAGDNQVLLAGRKDVLDGMGSCKLPHLRSGKPPAILVAGFVRYPDLAHPVESGVRPGMQNRVVENTVNRYGCCDPERERQDRSEREPGIPGDLPQGKAEVLKERLHRRLLCEGKTWSR